MSGEDINLVLNERKEVGKGLKRLKREGIVPTVIQAPGKDSVVTSGAYGELLKVYQVAGKHHPVQVSVGSTEYLTIIKEVDFDPKKHTIRHVVFGVINKDVKVETEVPIHLEGEAPAQKKSLIVAKQLDHVKLEALPKDLPDSVSINIEGLSEVGDKISVADIAVQPGVTILTDPDLTVAAVEEVAVVEVEEVAEEVVAAEAESEEATEEK